MDQGGQHCERKRTFEGCCMDGCYGRNDINNVCSNNKYIIRSVFKMDIKFNANLGTIKNILSNLEKFSLSISYSGMLHEELRDIDNVIKQIKDQLNPDKSKIGFGSEKF